MNLLELENAFGTEEQCIEYLFKLRWSKGYHCPRCSCVEYWQVSNTKYKCRSCAYQSSVISGTIFQDTHKPLKLWFRAIWYVTSQKNGTSALGLQRILGLGSYRTAWTWMHKLRRAMIRPGRDKLQGCIEVDEAYIGGPEKGGKRGRGTQNKVLIVVAVEINDKKLGRIRIGIIENASSDHIHAFIQESVETGSVIITDGWLGYNGLDKKGYVQEIRTRKTTDTDNLLPHVHTVVSLLKRWILGTLQGSCSAEHMAFYLDEYCFRFNRRKSKSRGLLFYRLLQNAVQMQPSIYKDIVMK